MRYCVKVIYSPVNFNLSIPYQSLRGLYYKFYGKIRKVRNTRKKKIKNQKWRKLKIIKQFFSNQINLQLEKRDF